MNILFSRGVASLLYYGRPSLLGGVVKIDSGGGKRALRGCIILCGSMVSNVLFHSVIAETMNRSNVAVLSAADVEFFGDALLFLYAQL